MCVIWTSFSIACHNIIHLNTLLGDWNGHVGSEGCGFEEVHGGKGFGVRNTEGERLLEFAVANEIVVGNTRFTKRESHLATYCSGIHKTQID